MKLDYYEYRIATHYLHAIVNADETGMEESECAELNAFLETIAGLTANQYTADVVDDSENFTRDEVSGLFANCATVRFYFPA